MKKFKVGDKVKLPKPIFKWHQFLLKRRLKNANLVGWINRDLEHLAAYEVYTNEGIWLIGWGARLELLK